MHCFVIGVQEKLGILNGSQVYAVYDYESQNPDELSFKDGDAMTVMRKGDEQEREWWWAKRTDHEGYVPRNLLGVCVHRHLPSMSGTCLCPKRFGSDQTYPQLT